MAYKKTPGAQRHDIERILDLSAQQATELVGRLERRGLLEDGRVTARGICALAPYKVDNAIIMAAGVSSRFAPLSYVKPKGLLRARNEILIERQIEQLIEAGISDIVLVVGYKKESFFYLEDKYNVQIVVNKEFFSRNNNSTLMCVREVLGNSYICSSDDYFVENPFETHVWKSYYAAQYSDGPTDEWCIQTDGDGCIASVHVGGANAWYMIGHAYFDREFANAFIRILEDEYENPQTADKLWEQLFLEHVDSLSMEVRPYDPPIIYEFDSLDDLRKFDPYFLDNVDIGIFDHICAVLGCDRSEIHDVFPLKQGLTNLSCHFATSDGEYVYRHPGIGTEQIIDRAAEMQAQVVAKNLGLDDTFIFENPKRGWKLSRYLPACRQIDPHNSEHVKRAMEMARTLHEQGEQIGRTFDFLQESEKYEELLRKRGPLDISDYDEMARAAHKVKECADADGAKICLCHNDFFDCNLLLDSSDKLYLIDWEYAGMSDYASDFGTFVVSCRLSDEEARDALAYYFGRTPTESEIRHHTAYVALAAWCWYVWALHKEAEGGYAGEWLYVYYRYAKKYLARALSAYGVS